MKKIIAFLGAIAVALTLTTTAFAEEEKTIALLINTRNIGLQNVITDQKITFIEGESLAEIVERGLGKENINGGTGVGTYISSIAFDNSGYEIPKYLADFIAAEGEEITAPASSAEISSGDFTASSGWMYFINGESASVSMNEYYPKAYETITLSFSVFGYGSDLGMDNSSWGGYPPITASNTQVTDSDSDTVSTEETADDKNQPTGVGITSLVIILGISGIVIKSTKK